MKGCETNGIEEAGSGTPEEKTGVEKTRVGVLQPSSRVKHENGGGELVAVGDIVGVLEDVELNDGLGD